VAGGLQGSQPPVPKAGPHKQPLRDSLPRQSKRRSIQDSLQIQLHNDGITRPWANGLLQASGRAETLRKSKPLKMSHWEGSYDRKNNRLGEMTGKEQAGRTENIAAEQTPGSNCMDY